MKPKIRYKKKNSNPFGGILYCMEEMRQLGIDKIIDKQFPKRVKQAKFKYSDAVLSWIYSIMCGNERLEDTKQLKPNFKDIAITKLPSPDSLAIIFKKLATPTVEIPVEEKIHEFNVNIPLNSLLMDVAIKLNQISTTKCHVLDYDNVVIECEKYDSKYSFKKHRGYSPGVALIGHNPIYIEGMNGNTPATFKMEDTLQRVFDLAKQKNIKIKTVRSDAAAYTVNVIKMLVKNNMEFFIRAHHTRKLFKEIMKADDWEPMDTKDGIKHVTSIDYKFNDGNTYRVVVTKYPSDEKGFVHKHAKDNLVYRAIITNNRNLSNKEVVHFYNKRGDEERNFSALKNDWNWKRLPFSYLNENVAFMIIGAIGKVMYNYLISKFSKKVSFLKPSYQLKKFIFFFISVCLMWEIEDNEKVPIICQHEDDLRNYSRLEY